MPTTTARHKAAKETSPKNLSADRLSSDLAELKASFGELRKDVTRLLRTGSGTAKGRIIQRPLLSVAMALGIGFVFAKLFMRKR
jgi:hypothetical protein